MAGDRPNPPRDGSKQGEARRALDRIPAFRALPDVLRRELASVGEVHRFEKGQAVAAEGARLDHVGVVTAGVLQLHRRAPDLTRHLVGLLFEGDMFGRVFDGRLRFSVEAAEEAEICRFPAAAFGDLATRWIDLDRLVVMTLLDELDAAREWLALLTPHRISQRLAGFLLLLCRRWSNATGLVGVDEGRLTLTLALGRGDLASLLGTGPDSLDRAFRTLSGAGLIRLEGPARVEVLDLAALAAYSGHDDVLDQGRLTDLQDALSDRRTPD